MGIFRHITKHSPIVQIRNISNYPHFTNIGLKPPWNILFFGSDDFAVESLNLLHSEYRKGYIINKLEVVTTGSGKFNPIRKFATRTNLNVYNWPITSEMDNFHVGLVVSFGHLIPSHIIDKFPLGMINVHASLLPRWRGAAPIIHAIANGDKKTGISIMKIKPNKFDIGDIILQHEVEIPEDILMPELYKKLARIGAQELVQVVKELPDILEKATEQSSHGVTLAPKVDDKISKIAWNESTATEVFNRRRALEGLTPLISEFNNNMIKLFNVTKCDKPISRSSEIKPGLIVYNKKSGLLEVQCSDGQWINVEKVGLPNKKPMSGLDFRNGYLNKLDRTLRILK